jgi:pimeloyl-ACP methyl ester carboxylesterase
VINFKVSGDGDTTVIFVHGFGCALADWAAQVAQLSPRFKCIAMDLPGHGASPVPNEHTMQALADAVNRVKQEAGTKHVVLVGHSLGTRVITDAYLQSPDKVLGLVFVDGRYYDGDPAEVLARMTALVDGSGFSGFIERAFPGMFTERSSLQMREQITRRAMALDPVFGRAIFLESILWDCTHGREKIGQIRVPVLLLQSTDIDANRRQISMQPGMRTRYMDVVSELVADADVKIVANVGHFAMLEAPDEVSREINNFVNSCPRRVSQA